jgi:PAS domain S-box-containing protein
MKDDNKTKKQLIDELTGLRSQNAALKESENTKKHPRLVEDIKDVIYELDSQGVVLYISPSVRNMLGFDADEIVGKNFTELVHKDDQSSLEEWFSELRKGREYSSEYRICDKSGDLKWTRTDTRPIIEDGQFKGARGILIDITAQRRSVEALRESEEKYRLSFENIKDIIYTIDAHLNFVSVSPSIERMLGYKPQDFIGRPASDLANILTPEAFEQAITNFSLILKGEATPAGIYQCAAKDGTIKHLEASGSPVIREGKVVGIISVARDITERKQAEESLRKSEEKFRWVLNNMADVITVMDMNLRFTYVSPSIIRMRGYTAEEAVSQTFEQVMTPESLQISAKVFEEEMKLEVSGTADPDRIRIVEVEQYRKDGSIVLMENHLSFMRDEAKKPVGIISVSHDITKRKQAEAKIKKQADAMEAAIDGIALLNEDQEYTYLNQAHAMIYGYEHVGELVGKSWRTLYDADELKRFDAEIMPIFGQTGYWQGEALGMKKDGIKFSQEISLTALHGGGVVCVVRDITQRKQAEQTLRQSEERFRMVMKDQSIIVAHIDQDLRYTWIYNSHPAFEEGAVLGKRDDEISVNEGTHQLVQLKRKSIETGSSARSEITFSLPEGETTYDIMVEPIRDEKGEVIGATTAAFDITERKQAEQALRDSESKYRLLAENVSDVIYTLDMDLRYTYISPSVKLLQGFEPAELLNQSANDTITHSSVELVMKALSEVMELEKSGHGEIPVSRTLAVETIRKDGTTIWTKEKFSLLKDEKKQPIGILGISRDISERKQSEEKLQQTLENLRKAFIASIQLLVSAVEARDPYTAGHQIRSANLARAIATEMGLPRDKIEGLRMAGSIHDIGKLSIPAEILSKPTKLTNIEFSLIKEHSVKGYEMLKGVESPWPLAEIVYQHHERMDGSGYPRNLKGDEIIVEARIMAVADVVESMASHRPYRPTLGTDAALAEIENNKGTLYDADAVDACLRLFREKGFQL